MLVKFLTKGNNSNAHQESNLELFSYQAGTIILATLTHTHTHMHTQHAQYTRMHTTFMVHMHTLTT